MLIILFQNVLLSKEFLACNGCFGLFTKIRKWSGTRFWWTFCAWFFHKNVPYLIVYQWTTFQCHAFFSSHNIKENVLLSFYLDSWCYHKLLRFILDQALKQWLTERRRGQDGNTKIWISWEWKELFRWNKKIFHSFWKALIWWKKNVLKNSRHKL